MMKIISVLCVALLLSGCAPLTMTATIAYGGSDGSKQDVKIQQVQQETEDPAETLITEETL